MIMSPPLHVVLVDPWVSTPNDIGPDRFAHLTRGIAAAGHHVTILAARSLPQESVLLSAVEYRRVLAPLNRRFGFPADARPRRGYGLGLLLRLLRLKSPDIVVLRAPPVKGALAAAFYSFLSGVPLAVDAREIQGLLPGRGVLSKLADKLRLAALRAKTRHVFAASADVKAWFEARGFAPEIVTICPDGCDTSPDAAAAPEAAAALLQRNPQLQHGVLAVYAGSLNRGRRAAELLDVAAALQPLAPDVNILIVGDGADRLQLNAYAARLDVLEKNVWFIPAQPRAIAAALLRSANIAMALPPQHQAEGVEAGSHIFEGLAAGKPVAVLGEGWQKDLIEGRQAGVILPANNPEAAARELADFLRDPDLVRRAGEQAAALARGKHDASRIAVDMRQTLEKTVAAFSRHDVMRKRFAFFKRAFDIVLSFALLVALSPAIVLIALALILAGWAPFARRERGGRRGKAFKLLTFDTTRADQGLGPGQPGTWAHGFAHFLRRSALDRLPELLNVLAGHMSLVGPRPLPSEYTVYYTEAQMRRLDVRPGLTGWAQVNGRQGLSWEEMFAHDLWYVNNRSFGLDLKILWRTFTGLFKGHGAAPLPQGQIPRFDEIEARRQGAEDV